MGGPTAELNTALTQLGDTKTALRKCYQMFLANYLLEHGYLDVVQYFLDASYTDTIVVPNQYRASSAGVITIVEVHCHS